jgi:hypothetical protein
MFCSLRFRCGAAVLAVLTSFFVATSAHAQLSVIGNWEQGAGFTETDQWLDWNAPVYSGSGTGAAYAGGSQGTLLPGLNGTPTVSGHPVYSSSTIGATLGSQSLELQYTGYNQNLGIKLEYANDAFNGNGDLTDFFNNRAFAIDITYGPYSGAQNTLTSSYQEMYQIALNGPGFGFNNLTGTTNPVAGTHVEGFPSNGTASPAYTFTMSANYKAALDQFNSEGYAEFILSTNSDANHGTFYFDNARFYTPGDMNNDGFVDVNDIKAMELALTDPTAYQNTYFNGNPNYTPSDRALLGDVNGDGAFSNADLQALITEVLAGGDDVSAVPEPASLVLLGLAASALLWVARGKFAAPFRT